MRNFSLSLRATTLLSLISLSTQQATSSTSTWGEPFTVDNSATATVVPIQPSTTTTTTSESTENLLPSSSPPSLITDSRPAPLLSVSVTGSGTHISGLQSVVSVDSTFSLGGGSSSLGVGTSSSTGTESGAESTGSGSLTTTTTSRSGVSTSPVSATGAETQSTAGAAALVVGGGFKKMGVVGALAGAAGVLFV